MFNKHVGLIFKGARSGQPGAGGVAGPHAVVGHSSSFDRRTHAEEHKDKLGESLFSGGYKPTGGSSYYDMSGGTVNVTEWSHEKKPSLYVHHTLPTKINPIHVVSVSRVGK